jgi:UDP-glucose 4-epimerase
MPEKTVVVTGAAGFLGSHLADALLAKGYRVIGIDNLSRGSLENLSQARAHKGFEFHQEDVCDLGALLRCVDEAFAIAHLAAFKIPRYGQAIDTLTINSQGTLNALELASRHRAKFLLASTSDVYGKNPSPPFSESSDCVLGPSTIARWAYAVSKLYDEHLALAFAEAHGIPVSIVRIFGSYGPRQNLSWWGGPQSVFISAVLRGETIPIHGDGSQTRSFTYVGDTVNGLVRVLENGPSGEVFNIGNTRQISILQLAHMIYELLGERSSPKIEFVPYEKIAGRKYEDVMRRIPDITKARDMLGFAPMVALEEGLRTTIDWQRQVLPKAEMTTAS